MALVPINMDKNFLLDQYSHSGGNNAIALKRYCESNDIQNFLLLTLEFESMQKYLWEHISELSVEEERFTPDELASITAEYCNRKFNWINQMGIHAMNRWVVSRCWKQGILTD